MNKYQGLTNEEAKGKLLKNGKNILVEEKERTLFQIFLSQIFNFTNLILTVAIIISFILKDYSEAGIVAGIIIINAIIGVVQEGKAQRALSSLKKMSALKANVIRNGEIIEIPSEEIVVDDIVSIDAGQQIPADIKLLETHDFSVDEKILTGESVPVEKDANTITDDNTPIGDKLNYAFMSTVATYGRAIGVVEKTGMNTEIGKIADMVNSEKKNLSPLQKAMDKLSKMLGIACVFICVIVCLVGILQGKDIYEMLMTSVSLAVAAIPEGIPTIITIVMALGMIRMAKLNAIVKKLSSVETLGSVSYVCSDKTGTLTMNKMTVVKAFVDGKFTELDDIPERDKIRFLKGLVLCNDAYISDDGSEIGDPTETALLSSGISQSDGSFDYTKNNLELIHPRISEWSFDSERKLMTTVHKAEKHNTVSFTKGSTDIILTKCSQIMDNGTIREITGDDKKKIFSAMNEMSLDALRVLSLAVRYNDNDPKEDDMIYLGMVGMIDPERPEVASSVKVFGEAGIKVIMITGDHKATAFAIAKKLGISNSIDECIDGSDIDKMSDDELTIKIKNISVFSRVSPEHKVRIVKALQDAGNVVSMTGDGVNDAPSLKAADVGVAMGITGTDVAKGAADIVLQDDSFTTIEKAIREGRNIYQNLKKSIIFAISSNLSEIFTIFTTIILGFATPLKAVHILTVNLLTDSLPCFALGTDTNSSFDVMKQKPRKNGEGLFANGGLSTIITYGLLITFLTIVSFLYPAFNFVAKNGIEINLHNLIFAYSNAKLLTRAQTYSFCVLALSELSYAIGMRNTKTSIFKFKWLDNKLMLISVAVGIAIQVVITEIPILSNIFSVTNLSLVEWLCIFGVSIIPLVMHEILVVCKRK